MNTDKPKEKGSQVTGLKIMTAGDINLTEEQRVGPNPEGYSQCVRAHLQNWRQGTVGCKGRSDVSFSNKKPWKQKVTGRARAGSARSPIWRSGGVTFGPQPRTRKLSIPRSLKRQVCNSLLWEFLESKKIMMLDWTPQEGLPKTAYAYKALKNAGIQDKNIILFVTAPDSYTHSAFANIPNVRMLLFDQWNAYDISNGDVWVVLQKDMDFFKGMVDLWI